MIASIGNANCYFLTRGPIQLGSARVAAVDKKRPIRQLSDGALVRGTTRELVFVTKNHLARTAIDSAKNDHDTPARYWWPPSTATYHDTTQR